MNSRIIALLVLIGTSFLGFIKLLLAHRENIKTIDFVNLYTEKFMEFARSDEIDGDIYSWLIRNSVKMQNEMGVYGIVNYKPPGTFNFIRDYEAIVNFLPEMINYKQDRDIYPKFYANSVRLYWEALTRYRGVLDEAHDISLKRLKNPFVWLQTGVQVILMLPLFLLKWFGLVQNSKFASAFDFSLVKIFSRLLALVEFVSALVTIIIGWDKFIEVLTELWNRIL